MRAREWWILPVVMALALVSPAAPGAQEKVRIDGSTGVAPLVAALAKAFQATQPGYVLEIGKGLGTKARLKALEEGKIQIAMASHGIDVEQIRRQGMTAHRVARTPIVFAVHAGVPVQALSDAQVCQIYSRTAVNWKALGGPDLPIAALTRPDSEVDAEVARAGIACLKNLKMAPGVKVMGKSGDMARGLAETQGAVGMTTSTQVQRSLGKIRAVALNGVQADEASVTAGRYRLTRDAYLLTRGAPPAPVAAFLSFVKSAQGAAVIQASGGMPAR